MSEPVAEAMTKMRQFMFERVYTNKEAKSEETKAERLVVTLYDYFLRHMEKLPDEYRRLINVGEPLEKVVCDFIASMTDRYAIALYEELYIPKSWNR